MMFLFCSKTQVHLGYSNFSSLDGTAQEPRPLPSDPGYSSLGNGHYKLQPRIPKHHDGGGRWTKIAAAEEPPPKPPGEKLGDKLNDKLSIPNNQLPAPSPRQPPSPDGPTPFAWLALAQLAIQIYIVNSQGGLLGSQNSDKPKTAAVTTVDGKDIYGVNSTFVEDPGFRTRKDIDPKYRLYTDRDYANANRYLAILMEKYPEVMKQRPFETRKPNDALLHAEATLLLRAADELGGTLAGRNLAIYVDRPFCPSCEKVIPYLAYELGNPAITIRDVTGATWFLHDKMPPIKVQ